MHLLSNGLSDIKMQDLNLDWLINENYELQMGSGRIDILIFENGQIELIGANEMNQNAHETNRPNACCWNLNCYTLKQPMASKPFTKQNVWTQILIFNWN